ncbi:MAG: ThuA domain-containing protein [Pirellula sp.]
MRKRWPHALSGILACASVWFAGNAMAQQANPKVVAATRTVSTESLASPDAAPMNALIIDGQNNHGVWPKTTMMIKKYLEDTGLYRVDIARTKYTWQGAEWFEKYPLNDGIAHEALGEPKPDPNFNPEFSKYSVVISNLGYGAAPWPEATRKDFEKYVAGGGGFVVLHAADNSFGDWSEFNKMIGLGGWGGRNEKSGPYVYLNQDEKEVRDNSPGNGGSHGSQHEFPIIVRDAEHPITKGLPKMWLHAQDELYDRLRGPAVNMKVLATAFAAQDKGGTGRHEPMIMTIDYGKGRVFHTPMGHGDYSMECVGFITVLLRGTEWAATGAVVHDQIPKDFPTADKSSKRPF